jgi:hypothetical protein
MIKLLLASIILLVATSAYAFEYNVQQNGPVADYRYSEKACKTAGKIACYRQLKSYCGKRATNKSAHAWVTVNLF